MPDNTHGSNGGPFEFGRPRNGTNGSHLTGMRAHPVPFEELAEPVDLVAVQADDELINALAAGMSVSAPGVGGYDADDRVAAILAAWKAEVEVDPIPELVDLDTAVSTVLAARRPSSSRARHLAPVAAAAAFLVLAIGGVSVGSYNAQPDDALWGVSKVLYSERAESVEAAARVEESISRAKEALVAGQPVVAAQELARAEADLAVVRPQEGQGELAEAQDFLQAKAAETPQGQPVNPATPLATQPSRQVPESVRESQPSSPEAGSSTATSGPQLSATSQPEPGPEIARAPDTAPGGPGPHTGDTGPQPGPEDAATAPTSSPTQPSGNGEGEPDDRTTRPSSPTATSEGDPDPTTSPTPPPSSDGGDAPDDGPSAAGSEPAPAAGN